MKMVAPKKHLGQHFLVDENIARSIAEALTGQNPEGLILEIGPGMGVLTKYLLDYANERLYVCEIDAESVVYLQAHYLQLSARIISEDFLRMDLSNKFGKEDIHIIGNFPYNISSQIVFKIIDNRAQIPMMAGMFQKEVAERIGAKPGNKDYGIISVLTQAYYDVSYLFTVPEHVFHPPPKVKSGVIRMVRRKEEPACDQKLMKEIVKMAFNQRRKKLRNAISQMIPNREMAFPFEDLRAENLSVENYIELTHFITELRKQK